MEKIRTLNESEIECRVAQIKEDYCTLLLYKDARVDQKLLDEVFGSMNWKREHRLIGDRLYCTVSIWDKEKNQWISKEDVGSEKENEKEKSLASDSFKRACVNWGIGRELYSAPFIYIPLSADDIKKYGNTIRLKTEFKVSLIEYNESRNITNLEISDGKSVRWSMHKKIYNKTTPSAPAPSAPAPTTQPTPKKNLVRGSVPWKHAVERLASGEDIYAKLQATYNITEQIFNQLSADIALYKTNALINA